MKQFSACAVALGLAWIIFPSSGKCADLEKAKALFTERCVSCHGEAGAGDGPVGQALPEGSKPRNFQSQPMKVAVDLAKFKELLKGGGAGVGLSPIMPAQADLTDEQLEGLYQHVQSLKKK